MHRTDPDRHVPERRTVLAGAVGGLALPLLAACGSDVGGGPPRVQGTRAPSSPPLPAESASNGSTKAAPSAGKPLGPTSQIPVGGGHVFSGEQVVVTQPKAGEYKAFSAVCTHQGCLVSSVSNGQIMCPCHGSLFSASNGSVLGGPAPSPLPAERITVSGGTISLL